MLIIVDETIFNDKNEEDVLIIKKSEPSKLKGPENFRVCHNEDEFYEALDTNKEEFKNYLGQVKRLFNDTERYN